MNGLFPRDRRRLVARALLALALAAGAGVAQATTELFEADWTTFDTGYPLGNCTACHGIVDDGASPRPAALAGVAMFAVADQELPAGTTRVTLTPNVPVAAGTIYSWRYSTTGAAGFTRSTESAGGSVSLDVPPGGLEVSYCIGAHDGTVIGARDTHRVRCDVASISVAEPLNRPPVITGRTPNDATIALRVGAGAVTVSVTASDPDGDTLTYLPIGDTPGLNVTNAGRVFTFSPTSANSGTAMLAVDDGRGERATIAVPYSVAPPVVVAPPVRIASVAPSGTITLREDATDPVIVTLAVDPPDAASLVFGTSGGSPGLSVTSRGDGSFAFAPDGSGPATGTVRLTLESGATGDLDNVDVPYAVTMAPVIPPDPGPGTPPADRAPRILSIAPAAPLALETSGAARTVTLTLDDDGPLADLDITFAGGPAGLVVTRAGGTGFTLAPGTTAASGDLVFTVSDGTSVATASYRVVISAPTPVYRAPTLDGVQPAGPIRLDVDATATIVARFTPGSESGVAPVATSNASDVLSVENGEESGTFRLRAGSPGDAVVTVTLTDSRGTAGSVTVAVTVVRPVVDLPPAATDDSFVFSAPNPLIPVTDNDADPEGQSLRIVLDEATSAQGVALVVDGAGIRYQASTAPSGEDRFDYRVEDPAGQRSMSATVTVTASDRDGDGTSDARDNCPDSPNGDQLDTDSDGMGDVCDATPNGEEALTVVTGEQGRELVRAACVICHLSPVTGAPQVDDRAAWDARIAERGGIDAIVQSAVGGRGGMPAFGGQFATRALTEATLFMAGRRAETPVVDPGISPGGEGGDPGGGQPGTGVDGSLTDADLDDIADAVDNCPRVPNTDQLDSDDDGEGDACESDADSDGDGYPLSLDDNDGDARRLPSRRVAQVADDGSSGYVESDGPLSLGAVARAQLAETGGARGGVALDEDEFARLAPTVHGVAPLNDTTVVPRGEVFDVVATATGATTLRITLARDLPIDPALQVYFPLEGRWATFASVGGETLRSAPPVDGRCPTTSDSPNYRDGLATGRRCLALAVGDGDRHDADALADGRVPLAFRIVSLRGRSLPETSGAPATVTTARSSGGGALGWGTLLVLTLVGAGRRRRDKAKGYGTS